MYQSIGEAYGCDSVCSVQPAADRLQKGIRVSVRALSFFPCSHLHEKSGREREAELCA